MIDIICDAGIVTTVFAFKNVNLIAMVLLHTYLFVALSLWWVGRHRH
ncbi:MAG: hypothetical protein JWQ40_1417 [Segetibacter sp.]|nr:hypothetical protein [Segetibacter sp.]